MNFVYIEVYSGIQVWQLLAGFGGLMIIMAIWNRLERSRTLKNTRSHVAVKSCAACGWNGNTGSHVRNCPRCNGHL